MYFVKNIPSGFVGLMSVFDTAGSFHQKHTMVSRKNRGISGLRVFPEAMKGMYIVTAEILIGIYEIKTASVR
jgi:hypothetical protein